MFLGENSLYATPAAYQSLIGDKTKVATAFYINFLGFLGLLKVDDKAGAMVSYLSTEKKLRPGSITDENHDPSLVVKLAIDAGIISGPASIAATKLLFLIKSKKVKGADIADDQIRDIIRLCKIMSHKPHLKIYSHVNDFLDAKIDLKQLASQLYKIAKLPDFAEVTGEFRDLITRGGYISDLLKLTHPTIVATPNVVPKVAAAMITQGRTKSAHLPPDNAQFGTDAEYEHMLMHMFKMRTVGQGYLTRFGFMTSFDAARFKATVQRDDFIMQPNPHVTWDKHPFALWVKRRDQSAYDTFVKTMKDKAAGIVASPQVPTAAVQVQAAAASKPKPSQTITVSNTPTINVDSMNDLLKQDTTISLNATLKKYGITSSNMGVVLSEQAYKVIATECTYQPYLDGTLHSVKRDIPFMKWMLRVTGDRHWINTLPYRLVFSCMKHAGKAGDLNALFIMIKRLVGDLSSRYSMWTSEADLPEIVASAGLGDATSMMDAYFKYRDQMPLSVYTSAVRSQYTSIETILLSNTVGHSPPSVWYMLQGLKNAIQLHGQPHDAEIDSSAGYTISINEDVFHSLAARDQIALNRFASEKIFALKLVKYSTEQVVKLKLRDALKRISINSPQLGDYDYVSTWAATNDPYAGIANEISVSDLWQRLITNGIQPEWVFKLGLVEWQRLVFHNWSPPAKYREFIQYMIDKDLVRGMEESKFKKLFANVFYSGSSVLTRDMLTTMLSWRELWLTRYLQLNLSHVKIIQLFNFTYDPFMDEVNADQPAQMIEAFQAEKGEALKYFMAWKKNHPGFQPPVAKVYYWSLTDMINSAWFYLPGDAKYKEAMEMIRDNQLPPTLQNLNSTGLPFFRKYNPSLFKIIEEKMKASAYASIEGTMAYTTSADTEELSKAMLSSLKSMKNVSSTEWEKWQYVKLISWAKDHPDRLTDAARKALLQTYANNMGTLKTGHLRKDIINAINEPFTDMVIKLHSTDKRAANRIFEELKGIPRKMIIEKMGQERYLELIKDELYKYPIKPQMDLDANRIKQVLKYNKLDMAIPKGKKDIRTMDDIPGSVEKGVSAVGQLKIEEISLTEKDHELASIDLHKSRNNKHGDFALKVLNTFNVNFPGQKDRIEAFKKANPGTEVLARAFHGTGSVAASMILRNGFTVIPASDSSTVGRMLGSGIYVTNVSNKAAQYVNEGGFGRKFGTKGYLFEIECALGRPHDHHHSAGIRGATGGPRGNFTNAQSPEWAIKDPKNQMNIYRVHHIELVPVKEIDALAVKHNIKMNENTAMSFESYLKEREGTPAASNKSLFLFMDWTLPTDLETSVDMDDYKVPANVTLVPCADGVIAEVAHAEEMEPVFVKIPNTLNWLASEQEQVDMFFSMTK